MFVFKRMVALFLCVGVFLGVALLFAACTDDVPPKREGVLYGATFDSGVEGLEIPTQAIEAGGRIREPQMELREGYIFIGWKHGDRFWNFEIDLVDKNVELVAVWEVDHVSWDYTDGLSFSFNQENNAYIVSGYAGTEADVRVPLYYSGDDGIHKVVAIGESAFRDNQIISSISLPTSIVELKDSAFMGSTISEFEIPVNLTAIGEGAFRYCRELVAITSKNQTKPMTFGDYAFSGSGLEHFLLYDNVTEIGDFCFYNSELSEFVVGSKSSLVSIGESAFEGTNLSFFKSPSGVTRVGSRAFASCDRLEKIVFPSLDSGVGVEMFCGDSALKGVYYIGEVPEHQESDWKGIEVFEFAYSSVDVGVAGRWNYGGNGLPEQHRSNRLTHFDFTSLSEILREGEGYSDYMVAAYHYRNLGSTRVLCDIITANVDENGFVEILLDEYCDSLYNVYVFKIGNDYQCPSSSTLFIMDVDMAYDNVVFINPSVEACHATAIYPQGE